MQLTSFKVLQAGRGEIAALLQRTVASNCNRLPYSQAFGSAFSPISSKLNDPNYYELCQSCVEFIRANFAVTGTTQIFGVEVKGAEPIGFRSICRREGVGYKHMAHAIYAKTGRDINLSYVAPALVSDLALKVRNTIPATGAAQLLGIDRITMKSLEVAGLVKSVPRFGDSSPGYSRGKLQDLLARICLIVDATFQESNLRTFDLMTKARAH